MLEQLVRPFQTPTTIADKASPVTTIVKVAPQKAILVWGAVGQDPEMFSVSFEVSNAGHTFKELKRITTDVRIQNPDDASQFIVAQRIDAIQFAPTTAIGAADLTSFASAPDDSSVPALGKDTTSYRLIQPKA